MTVEPASPEDMAVESARIPMANAGRAQHGPQAERVPAPGAKPDKDGAEVSNLSRLMSEEARKLEQDMEVRPDKVQLFRTKLEKGFEITDDQIDAIWDRMLDNI